MAMLSLLLTISTTMHLGVLNRTTPIYGFRRLTKDFASLLKIAELVEAGTSGREQNYVIFGCDSRRFGHSF